MTPEEAARALVTRLREEGKQVEAYFYDADHAFFNDTRPEVYDPESSALAWGRTLEFLREHLR